MVENETEKVTTLEVVAVGEDIPVTGKIIVTLEGNDYSKDLAFYGLTMDSTSEEIMTALRPAIQEQFQVDITDLYKVTKAVNNNNIYIIPNSTAGKA